MKKFITLLLICISTASIAQFAQPLHYGFPVRELDTLAAARDTNTFYHHPIYLDVYVSQKTFSINHLDATTTYKETVDSSQFYTAKDTKTNASLEIPKVAIDLQTAVNADNSLNIPRLNGILFLWGLQFDPKSTLRVIIPQ